MLQPGRYTARATEAALGHTSKGNEQVAVLFEVVFNEGTEVEEREQLTWYGYFTDKTTDRTFEALQLCGCEDEPPFDFTNIGRNEVSIVVEHEADQNGVERARVKWVNKLGAGGIAMKEKMGEDAAATFAKKMRGQFLAYKQRTNGAAGGNGAAKPKPAPKPQREPGDDTDDLNF
jgi:hypothetical protein